MKRIFDFSLAMFGIIISLPLWLLFGLLIWLEDRGPIFYSQNRVGKDGKIFKIIKFRSMVPDAEKFSGPAKAKEHDPRITNIGKILRTTAMDELPQLWNIFKGEMSFVGPRTERPEFVAQFSKNIPKYNLRHTVTPGLTGLAQILGSAYSEPEEKLKYDIWYIKNQGFFLDVHLIFLSFLITFMAKWTTKKSKYELLPGKLIKKIKNQVK